MRLQTLLTSTWIALIPLTADLAAGSPNQTPNETEWQSSLPAALSKAEADGRPILVYFWLDGSSFCQQIYADTLTTEEGVKELSHFVCVSVEANQAQARELVQRFGVSTLPTLVILDSQGQAEDAIEGYIPLEGFLVESQRIRNGTKTVSDWRRQAEAAPEDLDVRLRLALQLEHVGLVDESNLLQTSIREDDPRGLTIAGAQLQLWDAFAAVRNAASDPSDSRTYELKTLYQHMARVKPKAVRLEGWRWIADVEMQRGDRVKERAALTKVWEFLPEGTSGLDTGFSMLGRFFQMEVELTKKERRLAMEIAKRMALEAARSPGSVKQPFVHHAHAMALAINGDRKRALQEAEKAVELDPDTPVHQRLRDLLRPPG